VHTLKINLDLEKNRWVKRKVGTQAAHSEIFKWLSFGFGKLRTGDLILARVMHVKAEQYSSVLKSEALGSTH